METNIECPIKNCNYNDNMREFDKATAMPLNLHTTRSNTNLDAHRDMDGFDVNKELARLRRAIKEVGCKPENLPTLQFIAEAFSNIDEHLLRLGDLPRTWGN